MNIWVWSRSRWDAIWSLMRYKEFWDLGTTGPSRQRAFERESWMMSILVFERLLQYMLCNHYFLEEQ